MNLAYRLMSDRPLIRPGLPGSAENMHSSSAASASHQTKSNNLAPEGNGQPGRDRWGAVIVVALATFIVVTAEMMPIGLLTPIGRTLGEAEGTVGLSLTITGVVAAITAPFIPVATSRFDRRSTLIILMVLVAAANALTAAAPSFAIMTVARVLLGVSMGGVWALAASLAPRLARARSAGLAATVIFAGIAVASVLGVPGGTYIGAAAGWRATFWILAALAFGTALAMFFALPKLPTLGILRLGSILAQFRNPGVRTGLAITALLVSAHFAAYTYARPALEHFSDLQVALIGAAFLSFGVLGVVGNFLAGPSAARSPKRILIVLCGGILAILALFPLLSTSALTAMTFMGAWGLFYGGVSVATQAWIGRAAPEQREAAAALWVSVFNASIAFGAFGGGQILTHTGPRSVFWVAASCAVVALLCATTGNPRASQRRC